MRGIEEKEKIALLRLWRPKEEIGEMGKIGKLGKVGK